MQPPQNPYGTPDPYGQPNPYGAPAPNRGVSLDVIGEAWKLVQANLGPWIGAALIYGLIAAVFNMLQVALQAPGSIQPTPGVPAMAMREPTLASNLVALISIPLLALVVGGITNMAIGTVRTGRADFSRIFDVGAFAVPVMIASVLTTLIAIVGTLLCIIPGIIASVGLMLTTALVVDTKRGPLDAMGESWNAMKPHLLPGFLLLLVLGLVNLAGFCACGVGLLVTFPITMVSLALVYRDLFGGSGSAPQNPNFPSAPIADPRF